MAGILHPSYFLQHLVTNLPLVEIRPACNEKQHLPKRHLYWASSYWKHEMWAISTCAESGRPPRPRGRPDTRDNYHCLGPSIPSDSRSDRHDCIWHPIYSPIRRSRGKWHSPSCLVDGRERIGGFRHRTSSFVRYRWVAPRHLLHVEED